MKRVLVVSEALTLLVALVVSSVAIYVLNCCILRALRNLENLGSQGIKFEVREIMDKSEFLSGQGSFPNSHCFCSLLCLHTCQSVSLIYQKLLWKM